MASRTDSHFRSARLRSHLELVDSSNGKEKASRLKRLARILKKPSEERNEEDDKYLAEDAHLIPLAESRIKRNVLLKERNVEKEDPIDILREKCQQLVAHIRSSKSIIVYTGAGISTSANIPDYRGPNGVWSQLHAKKVLVDVPMADLVCAEPTFTHLALTELHKQGIVSHIVSQNCDGLHLRSGLPQNSLSEVHGNMFLEICSNCHKPYWRDFDVTERTSFHRHRTGRFCHNCPTDIGYLHDTIIHFGEKAHFSYPYDWLQARCIAQSTDVILCLGTSLAVLKKYSCLWPKKSNSGTNRKPKLVIVNLQWTPKDTQAILKINGRCDDVLKIVCESLEIKIPQYDISQDPLLSISIPLRSEEISSHKRIQLSNLVNQESSSLINQQSTSTPSCKPGWFGKGLKVKRRSGKKILTKTWTSKSQSN